MLTLDSKPPSDGTCLGEPPGGFCDVGCHFIFDLHFVSRLLYHVTGTPPWLLRPWRPPPALSSTPTTFDCLFFFIYRKRCAFESAFFTHRRFLPYAPSWHFRNKLLLWRPPWEPAVLPWSLQSSMLILETQTRPICLFDSQ